MTYLKLTAIGDATAVVLTDELLAQLNVRAGDSLRAETTSEGALLLTTEKPDRSRVSAMIDGIMDEYDETFRALAK